jgi:hypothetical protein
MEAFSDMLYFHELPVPSSQSEVEDLWFAQPSLSTTGDVLAIILHSV